TPLNEPVESKITGISKISEGDTQDSTIELILKRNKKHSATQEKSDTKSEKLSLSDEIEKNSIEKLEPVEEESLNIIKQEQEQ
ncbi:hypothetical protein, partial [Amphritea atlantica]